MTQEKKAKEKRPTLFMEDILTPPAPIPELRSLAPYPDSAAFVSNIPSTSISESLPPHSRLFSDKPDEGALTMLSLRFGTNYGIWHEKFDAFEIALHDPKGTPLEARMMAVQLSAIRHREMWAAQGLIRMTEGRQALADHLIKNLLAKATFLEGKADATAEVTSKDAEEDTKSSFRRDDGDTNIEISRGDIGHVEDPLSMSRTAMVGIVQPMQAANTDTMLNRDQENTGIGSDRNV